MLTLAEPSGPDHVSWKKGTNTAGGGMRALRIVVPVGMAIDILECADIEAFADKSVVECCLAALRPPTQTVHFLRPTPQVLELKDVNESKVHCKTLELELNYHHRMIRYQFHTPSRKSEDGRELTKPECLAKCKGYLKMWIQFIYTEKVRQLHFSQEMWPPSPPWGVADVYDMPIVLWLSKEKGEKGQKRTAATAAAPDDGHTAAGNDGHRHTAAGFGMSGLVSGVSGEYEF